MFRIMTSKNFIHEWASSLSTLTTAIVPQQNDNLDIELNNIKGHHASLFCYLNGDKMRTLSGLMDEFASTLHFFEGFGKNWHALLDCLRDDLEYWKPFSSIIFAIKNAEYILANDQEQLVWFFVTLEDVRQHWSNNVDDIEGFGHVAIPFHVALLCSCDAYIDFNTRITRALKLNEAYNIQLQHLL